MSFEEESGRTISEICREKWVAISDRAVEFYKACTQRKKTKRAYKEVYVCFRGGVHSPWQHALNKDFTHVFMLEDIVDQRYGTGIMQFEFLTSNINATHLPVASLEEYVEAIKLNGCTVVKVEPFPQKVLGALIPRLVPYNCVSLVKLYLGIRAYHAITPYKLFVHLLSKRNVTLQ